MTLHLSHRLKKISTKEWKEYYEGQGIFPSNAAGEIEYRILSNRWDNLHSTINNIGPLTKKEIKSEDNAQEILFAGETPITIELGKINSKFHNQN